MAFSQAVARLTTSLGHRLDVSQLSGCPTGESLLVKAGHRPLEHSLFGQFVGFRKKVDGHGYQSLRISLQIAGPRYLCLPRQRVSAFAVGLSAE